MDRTISQVIRNKRETFLESKLFGRFGSELGLRVVNLLNKDLSFLKYEDVGDIKYVNYEDIVNFPRELTIILFVCECINKEQIYLLLSRCPLLVIASINELSYSLCSQFDAIIDVEHETVNDLYISCFTIKKNPENNIIVSQGDAASPSITSNQQIRELYYSKTPHFKYFVSFILKRLPSTASLPFNDNRYNNRKSKFIHLQSYIENRIKTLLRHPSTTDSDIYNDLYQLFWPLNSIRLSHGDTLDHTNWAVNSDGRVKSRVDDVINMLPFNYKPSSILDIGCADGSILESLGKYYSLTKENLFGVDIRAPMSDKNITAVVGTSEDPNLLGSKQFDIIYCSVTLHHIPLWKDAVRNMVKWLKIGGYILIRDHDVESNHDRILLDCHDLAFGLCLWQNRENPSWEDFVWSGRSWFMSEADVTNEMKINGVKRLKAIRTGSVSVPCGEIKEDEKILCNYGKGGEDEWRCNDMRYYALYKKTE